MANDVEWTLLILKPNDGASGSAILKIILTLIKIIPYQFVILDYIFGATRDDLIAKLQELENQPLYLNDLLKVLDQVIQFDWADFFLFEEKPVNWSGEQDILYPPLVSETDTTIRAIDGTYVYVYTQYGAIIDAIKKKYKVESITSDLLENLSFPE